MNFYESKGNEYFEFFSYEKVEYGLNMEKKTVSMIVKQGLKVFLKKLHVLVVEQVTVTLVSTWKRGRTMTVIQYSYLKNE